MKKIIGALFLAVLFVTPAFAGDAGVSTTKPLSIIEFQSLPENHGMTWRVIQRRYEEYRSGRYVPTSTLDTSRMR